MDWLLALSNVIKYAGVGPFDPECELFSYKFRPSLGSGIHLELIICFRLVFRFIHEVDKSSMSVNFKLLRVHTVLDKRIASDDTIGDRGLEGFESEIRLVSIYDVSIDLVLKVSYIGEFIVCGSTD